VLRGRRATVTEGTKKRPPSSSQCTEDPHTAEREVHYAVTDTGMATSMPRHSAHVAVGKPPPSGRPDSDHGVHVLPSEALGIRPSARSSRRTVTSQSGAAVVAPTAEDPSSTTAPNPAMRTVRMWCWRRAGPQPSIRGCSRRSRTLIGRVPWARRFTDPHERERPGRQSRRQYHRERIAGFLRCRAPGKSRRCAAAPTIRVSILANTVGRAASATR